MVQAGVFLHDYSIFKSQNFIENPIISVIIPTYYRGDNGLLERSILSVLNQSFRSFELIIVDDGSVDKTESIVKDYLSKDERILYIRNHNNSGLPGLRVNQGLCFARGKYIAYLFDDDQYTPYALESLHDEISKYDELCLVYGSSSCYTSNYSENMENLILGREFCAEIIHGINFFANCSVMHHKKIVDVYGAYDPHLVMRRLCDWDLWRRWSRYIPFIWLNRIITLVNYALEDSIGNTCVLDHDAFFRRANMDRNNILRINNLDSLEIDSLEFIQDDIIRQRAYYQHILPWLKNKAPFLNLKMPYKNKSVKREIQVFGNLNASLSIMVQNFERYLNSDFRFLYYPEHFLPSIKITGDYLFFIRNGESNLISTELSRSPRILFIDDNLMGVNSPDINHQHIEARIRNADLVVCPNHELATEISKYNKNMLVIHTNIDAEYFSSYSIPSEKVRILLGGLRSRKEEYSSISDIFAYVAEKYRHKVEFFAWGEIPEFLQKNTKINIISIPITLSYDLYLKKLLELSPHIVLVPLFQSEKFKTQKSPIKILEVTACGAIGIYSKGIVYADVEDGVNGFLANNNPVDWIKAIEQVIALSETERKRIVDNARELIRKKYSTESQVPTFYLALESAHLYHYLEKDGSFFFDIPMNIFSEQKHTILLTLEQLSNLNLKIIINITEGEVDPDLHSFCINHKSIWVSIPSSDDLKGIILRYRIKVIHTYSAQNAIIYKSQYPGIPIILSIGNPLQQDEYVQIQDKACCPHAIIGNTIGIASETASVCSHWIQCIRDPLRQDSNISIIRDCGNENDSIILIYSKLSEEYGLKSLLKAISLLMNKDFSIHLKIIILGSVDEKEENRVFKYVNKFGINKNFSIYSSLTPIILSENSSLAIYFGPLTIGQSYLMELMAAGVPILLPAKKEYNEFFTHNYNAIICQNLCEDTLAQEISDILSEISCNSNRISEIRSNAKRDSEFEGNLLKYTINLLGVYNQAIGCMKKEFPLELPQQQLQIQERLMDSNDTEYYSHEIQSGSYNVVFSGAKVIGIKLRIKSSKTLDIGIMVIDSINTGYILTNARYQGEPEPSGKWINFFFDTSVSDYYPNRTFTIKIKSLSSSIQILLSGHNKLKAYQLSDEQSFIDFSTQITPNNQIKIKTLVSNIILPKICNYISFHPYFGKNRRTNLPVEISESKLFKEFFSSSLLQSDQNLSTRTYGSTIQFKEDIFYQFLISPKLNNLSSIEVFMEMRGKELKQNIDLFGYDLIDMAGNIVATGNIKLPPRSSIVTLKFAPITYSSHQKYFLRFIRRKQSLWAGEIYFTQWNETLFSIMRHWRTGILLVHSLHYSQ